MRTHPKQLVLTAAALAALAGVLTSCGPSDSHAATGDESGIWLSVPPETESGSLDLVVEQAGLEAGSEIRLYAYRTGWDNTEPSCQGTADIAGQMTVTGDSREAVSTTLSQGPGRYWWVLVADGYTSECGVDGTQTRLLAAPDVGLAQDDPDQALNDEYAPAGKTGKPYKFNVEVSDPPPGDDPWKVDVTWYGPFQSTPEAVSAGCTTSTPIGKQISIDADDADDHQDHVTLDEPGVYRVVADIDRTEESAEATSGCDDYSPFIVIK